MQAVDECMSTAKKIVNKYIKISLSLHTEECTDDKQYNYDLMTMCILWHAFHDSLQEGYWKVLFPKKSTTIMLKMHLHSI